MTTIRNFMSQCAVHIKDKQHFIGYWHPKGHGTIFLDDKSGDELMRVGKALNKLWEDVDVYPLFVVTARNGQYMIDEKSPVSDMLSEMVNLAKGRTTQCPK